MHNILLVWDRIGDYHLARVRALRGVVGNRLVFTADLAAADNLYKWKTENIENHFVLSSKTAEQKDVRTRLKNFKKIIKTQNIKYCCLAGYGRIEYLRMIIAAKLRGCKVLIFSESWYGRRTPFNILKSWFLNMFADVFLVSGIRARDFTANILKIKPEKIAIPYSVVDNAHFANPGEYNPNTKTMLCMARFSKEKNQEFLINAFLKSSLSKTWKLKLVGAGPLKETLEQKFKENLNVELYNWAVYNDLPTIYFNSSMFVLASTFEPWGLVVNEAMSAGLPVICSNAVGAMPDLVDGNGYTFDETSEESLIQAFNQVDALSVEQLNAMSRRSIEIIKNFTPEIWAQQVIKLLKI
ncbi:MAG: glycosyltransferase family 4 protein [Bacteroidales bacterium]|nr:glycosyltransferase family 4 protein [Bacteroidales bacterium]